MAGVNKVILLGRLGGDPDIRYMESGAAVANMTLATSENWKDKDGNRQEKTEWHKVVMFGKVAEVCGEYLHKGKQVYFEGRIQTRKWQDKEGNDRYSTEIVANVMQMVGSKGDDSPAPRRETQQEASIDDSPPDMEDIPFS